MQQAQSRSGGLRGQGEDHRSMDREVPGDLRQDGQEDHRSMDRYDPRDLRQLGQEEDSQTLKI